MITFWIGLYLLGGWATLVGLVRWGTRPLDKEDVFFGLTLWPILWMIGLLAFVAKMLLLSVQKAGGK